MKILNFNFCACSIIAVLGCCPSIFYGAPQDTWNEIRFGAHRFAESVKTSAEQVAKSSKTASSLARSAFILAKSMEGASDRIDDLADSLAATLKNIGKAGNIDSKKILFSNAMGKTGELLNLVFSILYTVNDIVSDAESLNLVKPKLKIKLEKALFLSLFLSTAAMNYLKNNIGPQVFEFLSQIESIKKAQ